MSIGKARQVYFIHKGISISYWSEKRGLGHLILPLMLSKCKSTKTGGTLTVHDSKIIPTVSLGQGSTTF